jgi:hypothetical protein
VTQTLSPGAVKLPLAHLSVRVPWHDTDWTGRVCTAPGTNHSCAVLDNIKEDKDAIAEAGHAGVAWGDLSNEDVPPCVVERAGFMRPAAFKYERIHPYAKFGYKSHASFGPTLHHMPKYSVEAVPFRWMRRDSFEEFADVWKIGVNGQLERRADAIIGRPAVSWDERDGWMQDWRNQLALLDSFFSALVPGKSLVLLYVKDLPLVEEPAPGERFLIGAGLVSGVGTAIDWENDDRDTIHSVLWERSVSHTVRPTFTDGFLLPYHQLLRSPELRGEDLSHYVARTPPEYFNEFSYVSELVPHDGAIAALTELARVVDLVADKAEGPWDTIRAWLGDRLADSWKARGPYPGLGPMLAAAGIERGPLLAQQIVDQLRDDEDPWAAVDAAISTNHGGLVGRLGRKAWTALRAQPERYQQLRIMSRLAVNVGQARELFDELEPGDVIENPYTLFESGLGSEPISLELVDRAMFPQNADAQAALARDPLPEPVEEAADDRRVRAASIQVLETVAVSEGHTVLDEPGLRKRLAKLKLTPSCDPVTALFDIAAADFPPLMVERDLAHGAGRAWQLDRLAAATDVIGAAVHERAEAPPLNIVWGWRGRIDAVLGKASDSAAERAAREEKAAALELIATRRISALIGPAGTGKTTMLEALCNDAKIISGGVLLLTPTGKAAVQLTARTKLRAMTVAQFLGRLDRYEHETNSYYLNPKAKRHHGAKTVVIDEASMLTEEMFAATIDALAGVDRLILCGDPRQLPPIGAGRPFVDLVRFLREGSHTGGDVAELRVVRRQTSGNDDESVPDDVAVASLFSIDAVQPGAEEAMANAIAGEGDGRVRVLSWEDEPDLHKKVVEALGDEPGLGLDSATRGAICRSFGAQCDDDGLPSFTWGKAGVGAESWQLLSPVRDRPGGVTGLNALVRQTWRGTDAQLAAKAWKFASPMGADGVIFADKVMCLRNDYRRKGSDPETWKQHEGGVANGEIGLIVRPAGKKGKRPTGHTIEFSTQPNRQYTFWEGELNGADEGAREWLQLAYAVTVHKAQGSQFKVTFVVIPDPSPLLSPELLYTALTRQQDKVVLLKQGSLANLRDFGALERSDTARRLTCLFRPADPFAIGDVVLDGAHIHRTARGEAVISKSEVIVADALHDLGVDYAYEAPLQFPGEIPRKPDFTVARTGQPTVYWEHLGMLDLAGYRAGWEAKKAWYAYHDILPHADGGGSGGVLVWSEEGVRGPGISSAEIREQALEVFGQQ